MGHGESFELKGKIFGSRNTRNWAVEEESKESKLLAEENTEKGREGESRKKKQQK